MDKVLIHVKKTAQVRAFGKLPSLSSEIALVKAYKIAKIKTGERLRFSHYAAELRHIGMKHPQTPRILENTAELTEPRHHVAHISVYARPLIPCRFGDVIGRVSDNDVKRLVGQ